MARYIDEMGFWLIRKWEFNFPDVIFLEFEPKNIKDPFQVHVRIVEIYLYVSVKIRILTIDEGYTAI